MKGCITVHAAARCMESHPVTIPFGSHLDCVFSGPPVSVSQRDGAFVFRGREECRPAGAAGSLRGASGPLPARVPSCKASVSRIKQTLALTPLPSFIVSLRVSRVGKHWTAGWAARAEVPAQCSPAVHTGDFLHLCVLGGPICRPHIIVTAATW